MSSHHPSSDLLDQFVRGDLDGSLSSIVSSHVEHCSSCKKSLKSSEQNLSLQAFNFESPLSSSEMSEAWNKLHSRLGSVEPKSFDFKCQTEIEILGLKFELPRSLKKIISKPIKWMPFGKGGRISKLGNENGKSLFLIYLPPNEEVPMHSHEGMEFSYVISGNYSADGLHFETGDFSCSSESVTHAPKAGSEDGCLLLSSVENRLNFIQGWLKPLNRLLWWFLNVRIKWM